MAMFSCFVITGILMAGPIFETFYDNRLTHGASTTIGLDTATVSNSTDGVENTTEAATTIPVGDPNCKDKLPNCLNFGHPSCTGPYESWAKANCQAFCGFCIPITSPFICEDKKSNCNEFGDDLCTNQDYVPFVEKNCLKYCHMCPGELTTPPPKTGCFDDFERCDEFGPSTCTNYPNWSQLYCARYCKFCESNETSEATTVAVSTTPASTLPLDPNCFDRRDCSGYEIHKSCCGPYEAFARYNCARHCRFCTPTVTEAPVCADTIPNCNQYNSDLCTNVEFEKFAETKCAGFCKVCERPVFKPDCAKGGSGQGSASPATTPEEKKCKSKGRSYAKGEIWSTDDCFQSCECQDPDTNQIKCGPLECPKPLPDCDLIYVPGGCCPVLKCSYLETIHGERTQEELNSLLGK